MKARNKITFIAGALAAMAALLPLDASAAGNIRRMDSTSSFPETAPARIGSEVTFSMVLDNSSSNTAYDLSWNLKYQGFGSEVFDLAYNPPMIAVKVSGETRYANLVKVGQYGSITQLTEVAFKYIVKPGDMAAPMEVVYSGGAFQFLNLGATALWDIRDANGTRADLSFRGSGTAVEGIAVNDNYNLTAAADESGLGQGPVYIKTLDFDSQSTSAGYWREIGTSGTQRPSVPRIEIGDAAATNGTVYVWISDETGTNVSSTVAFASGVETFENDYGQRVHPVTIAVGDMYETFSLKGLTTNGTGTAYIYLSAQPQNTFATGGYLVSNFTYRVVKVFQEEPTVRFEMVEWATNDKISSVACAPDYQTPVARIKAILSEPYTADSITINLNMKSASKDADKLFDSDTIRISNPDGNYLGKADSITLAAGETEGYLYIYGLGSEEEVTFIPTIASPADAAAFYKAGEEYGCTLKLNPCKPNVLGVMDSYMRVVEGYTFALTERKPYTFYLPIEDGYVNITTNAPGYIGYTVEWDRESDKAATSINPQTFTNIYPVQVDIEGDQVYVLPVTITYPYAGSYSNTIIYVTNPDGGKSYFPPSGTVVTVNVGESKKASAVPEKTEYGEGETVKVSFTLSEPYVDLDGNSLYAFLEPLNEAASNTTSSAQWAVAGTNELGATVYGTGGILISDTASVGSAMIKLLDGYSESVGYNTPRFGVRFCTSQTFDPKGEVQEYTAADFTIAVSNVYPTVATIYCDGNPNEGNAFTVPVIAGVDSTYEVVPSDPGSRFDIGSTDSNKCLIARWAFKGSSDRTWTYIWKFNLQEEGDSNRCEYAFWEAGTNNFVKVTLIDKDMRETGDLYWVEDKNYEEGGYWKTKTTFNVDSFPTETYRVEVTEKATILVEPTYDYFTEEDFLNGDIGFNVWLTEGANARNGIDVRLYIERMEVPPAGTGNLGLIEVTEYTGHIGQNRGVWGASATPGCTFYVSNIDGTSRTANGSTRFRVWAEVTTTSNKNGTTTPWSEYYESRTNSYFVVQNSAPQLIMGNTSVGGWEPNNETNRYTVEKNGQIEVKWQVSDVLPDLTNNLIVSIASGGFATTNFVYTSQSAFDEFDHTVTGKWSFAFTDSGNYTVTITATDKDNGVSRQSWYFTVAAGKNVFILPHVQDSAKTTSTTAAAPFIGAKARGVGSGRVWAGTGLDTGSLFGIYNFKHQWVYKPAASSSTFFAVGYQYGDVEGSLTPNDHDIDPSGNQQKSDDPDADHYTYRHLLDSFFYTWVFNTAASGEGGAWTSVLQTPNPQYGKGKAVEGTITLSEEDDDPTVSYPDIFVEAIFSKELYLADNMGDINWDGIPDWYAAAYPEASGQSESSSESSGSSSDSAATSANATPAALVNVSSYNGDGDFIPMANQAANPLMPGKLGWGPGSAFTFRHEIRGFGIGLNEPGVSDYELSMAEKMALMTDWTAAGNTPTGVFWDDYASATNWGAKNGWSCERRLDPTDPDTDGDGCDDGTEYFFWYYAKVGLVKDGNWKRMTGSKFSSDPLLIGKGVEIPSWAIASRFDPLSAAVFVEGGSNTDLDAVSVTMVGGNGEKFTANLQDFDEDGLSDLEEIALGLNPVNWDSDGDGISDLYEVIHGLDALDPIDGNRTLGAADFRNNPDRDFMAWMDSTNVFAIVSVIQEDSGKAKFFALEDDEAIFTFEPVMNGAEPATNEYVRILTAGSAAAEYFVPAGTLKTLTDEFDSVFTAVPVQASKVITLDGTDYAGEDVILPAGTGVAELSETVETVSKARLAATSLRGQPIKVNNVPVIAGGTEVFRYGNDSGPMVPVPLDGKEYSEIATNNTVTAFFTANLAYIHNQVFKICGFDPRTGYAKNLNGYVSNRWIIPDKMNITEGETTLTDLAGFAVNTAPYTSLDEYLVLQYRTVVPGSRAAAMTVNGTTYENYEGLNNVFTGNGFTTEAFILGCTTLPNIPLGTDESESSGGTNGVSYVVVEHGADTDKDGIPDGWELYVDINPNLAEDAVSQDTWADDDDKLVFLEEYAGTDSTGCYSNQYNSAGELVFPACETIFANHPSQPESGKLKNWYNKFFPSNPYDGDTDADGLLDHLEGGTWRDTFIVGRNEYQTSFSFIYGEPVDAGNSRCIAGAGLNPCSVDTDGDVLPDGWEYEFAGVVVMNNNGVIEPQSISLSDLDLRRITLADGIQDAATDAIADGKSGIRGGMDGTVQDANYDYDHDGLMNYQEYLVQSLRHLRYDDSETPLMGRQLVWDTMKPVEGPFVKFMPMSAWDGETFFNDCLAVGFTGNSAFKYRELGYFAPPVHAWDPMVSSGRAVEERIMLRPYGLASSATPLAEIRAPYVVSDGMFSRFSSSDCRGYATTDPRMWDSDNDGMDDYYELFHGLNPLLGSAADPDAEHSNGFPNAHKYDRIASIYGGEITAWRNAWTGWNNTQQPAFDAMRFPWMMGTSEADADGDGLRNSEEALMVNVSDPSPTHTDPTPLWMTDSSSTNFASYVAQYYRADPSLGSDANIFSHNKWSWTNTRIILDIAVTGAKREFMFTFEENEGYDTDHDFVPDNQELVKNVSAASSPLDSMDPVRRQGIWFPGENSAAVSSMGTLQHPISTSYDMLRQFTVEAWVKAEDPAAGREQIILERSSDYGASSLSNSTAIIRANFRLGINESGCFFGAFEGSTANSGEQVLAGPPATTNWTHLALTFDGSTFALRVNGNSEPAASVSDVGLIPANGIVLMEQDTGSVENGFNEFGYRAAPCAFIVGARAMHGAALNLLDKPSWDAYGSFFKGWVDEVRVWNRARTGTEINENYLAAFSREKLVELRREDYDRWLVNDTTKATLMQHYNFSGLPGAVDSADAVVEPSGYTMNVSDQVRIEGGEVPYGIACGWWASTPVRSTVYNNAEVVPWVANNVAHLPFLDGSVVDSQYWAEMYSGVLGTEDAETIIAKYTFPNTANPYPYYNYIYDKLWHYGRVLAIDSLIGDSSVTNSVVQGTNSFITAKFDSLSSMWRYELERNFVGTSDIVPLGGAFAKRCVSHWDGYGPMDAWENTVLDADGDGLPDWWEALYAGTGVNPGTLDAMTLIDYYGTGNADTAAWEAYLRDLANGMLPGGQVAEEYKTNSDSDNDGMPDFWERIYGIDTHSYKDAYADPDGDGLPNFVEYLCEALGYYRISPTLSASAFSGQAVSDYYLPVGKLYLGEMFTDHDLIEDSYEDKFSFLSRSTYDAHKDGRGNGWSNWSEARAANDTNTWIIVGYKENYTQLAFLNDGPELNPWLLTNTATIVQTEYQWVEGGAWRLDGIRYPYATRYTIVTYSPVMAYSGSPRPQVKATIVYNGPSAATNVVVKAWAGTDVSVNPAAVWNNVSYTPGGTIVLDDPDEGSLKQGKFMFQVYAAGGESSKDSSSSSSSSEAETSSVAPWTPGAPMGIVTDVDVGFAGAEFTVELTDTNPSMMRFNIVEMCANNAFDAQMLLNDRGKVGMEKYPNVEHMMPGLETALVSDSVRIRVVQSMVNGVSYYKSGTITRYANEVVYDNFINTKVNPQFDETLLVGAGLMDLNQGGIVNAGSQLNIAVANITSVTYRVVIGDGPVDVISTNNALATMFVNAFEPGALFNQTRAAPVSPTGAMKDSRPTFKWTHENSIGKDYPVFRLRVYRTVGAKLVYDSGSRRAPAKDANGVYTWSPDDLHVGEATKDGFVFENGVDYYWTVSMLDAKFTQPNTTETHMPFSTAVNGVGGTLSDKGSIAVAVRYFGPVTTSTNAASLANLIRVEAFARPDFAGAPAAVSFVKSKANIANPSNAVWNATLEGLDAGKWYVRAYIDTNGNRACDEWETWGYGNFTGTDRTDIYTPRAYTIVNGSFEVPTAVVTLEDADTNGNGIPDGYEWTGGELGDSVGGTSASPYVVTLDEKGASIVDLLDAISDDVLSLPYVELLRQLRNGGVVSAIQMQMIGIDLANAITEPVVKIKSFSRTSGVSLAVSTPTTVGGETLDTGAATVYVKVSLTLWYKENIGDEWTSLTTVYDTFEVNEDDGELDPEKLEELNAKLLDSTEGKSGFFKVTVE